MKRFLSILIIFSVLFSFAENTSIDFSYNSTSYTGTGYGYPRLEHYDICIKIDDAQLSGGIIRSMKVPIPQISGCSIDKEVSVWIITDLEDGEISESNSLAFVKEESDGTSVDAVFPEAVKIPEGGCYIGYSVNVDKIADNIRQYPIAIVPGNTPGALYFRSDTRKSWDNTSYRMEYMSPMVVTVALDLPASAASPSLPGNFRVVRDSEENIMLSVTNRGFKPINTVKYKISLPEYSDVRIVNVASEGNGGYGTVFTIPVRFDTPASLGDSSLQIDILEINNVKNMANDASARTHLRVLPYLPVFRPLVEEYTGLWCGNCPSGWVALEEAKERYGKDFIAIAYHVNDILVSEVPQPYLPKNVPSVTINRGELSAPGILSEWLPQEYEKSVDFDVLIDLNWSDASHNKLNAVARICFMEPKKAPDYSVEMILVADNLSNPYWGQTNYFAGQIGKTGKYWDIFTKGSSTIYGLTYNFVPVLMPHSNAIKIKLPEAVKEFEEYTVTELFDFSDCYSVKGVDLAQNPDDMRVVAVLIDNHTGLPVNANTSIRIGDMDLSGNVNIIPSEDALAKKVMEERYYSIDGRRLESPLQGIPYIHQTIYTDFTIKTEKCFH